MRERGAAPNRPEPARSPETGVASAAAPPPGMARPSGGAPDIAPGRRDGDAIRRDIEHHYPPLSHHEARVESDRCYFCHDAPCVTACPTAIDIPLFIRQIDTGNRDGAAKTIFEANILGGTCARVCPTEELCQGACVRMEAEEKPVLIGLLQRYATDAYVGEARPHPFERAAATGKRVAVVGAGPAGLACAHECARHGHEVTILEARPKPGGLNEYGIAAYKETGGFAQDEVDFVLAIGGIEIREGWALGRDGTLSDLKAEYDAVFLAIGLGDTNDLGMGGEESGNVRDAVDYIARLRQTDDLASLPVGRRVVVIGGGMTAIDIACQTKLLGADEVTVVYRRGERRMNASWYERDHARKLGVSIRTHLAPKELHEGDEGVTAMTFERVDERDGSLVGTGETITLATDQVFKAIGQRFEDGPLADSDLATERGKLRVDEERRTSDPKVWAGGDCAATGDDLTVVAVEDGKRAGRSIAAALAG